MLEYVLYNKDVKTKNIRMWKVCAIFFDVAPDLIIDNGPLYKKLSDIIVEFDWELKDVYAAIKSYKGTIYDGDYDVNDKKVTAFGLYWYENGIDTFFNNDEKEAKISRSSGNLVISGKNIGKKNMTTPFQQTIMNITSDYNKKKDKGYTEEKIAPDVPAGQVLYYRPMALHKFEEKKEKININNSCVQPKLDGVRVLMTLFNNQVVIYSRNLKPFIGFTELTNTLRPIFNQYPGIYLDGELYKPGISFETLVGIAKNENEKKLDDMHFYIFDSFIPDRLKDETFEYRNARLAEIKNIVRSEKHINVVQCYELKEGDDIYKILDDYSKEYEGIVIRDKSGLYETSLNKEIRSNFALKLKKFIDEEFEIVGFTHGDKGKEMTAIKYILKTENGEEFSAVPNQGIKERQELYKLYSTKPKEFKKVKGKFATIKYQDLTAKGIPRFCKLITIRDYE